MEILEKILNSSARVKIMRLFLLNKDKSFKNKDIAKRSRVSSDIVRRELKLLSSVGFIKKYNMDWRFNSTFKYSKEFEGLLISSDTINKDKISNNLKKTGKIKLLLISGLFIKNSDSRVDMLIVGDKIKRNKVEEEIRKIEAEIGKELSYAIFDSKEFSYRLNMYDKLVRDILDFPHEIILQNKEINLAKVTRQS
ncbi:MAG: hypothetical protein WCX46_03205 [Candidatus Paceibacterota bacterium]